MAVPDTLQEWREFVQREDPLTPLPMTMKQLFSLSSAEKERYDAERIAWVSSHIVLETHDIATLSRWATIAARRNAARSITARRGIAVSGQPTLGKSTAVMHLGKIHELHMRRRSPPS